MILAIIQEILFVLVTDPPRGFAERIDNIQMFRELLGYGVGIHIMNIAESFFITALKGLILL
jgi:hypothetical protein